MRFANPAGWWLLAMAPVVVAVHLRRRRAHRHLVSSTQWWGVDGATTRPARWGTRLAMTWPLLCQLLAVVLAALAVARPERAPSEPPPSEGPLVLVVDTSGSMTATDGVTTRLEQARAAAAEVVGDLPPQREVAVVELSGSPSVVLGATEDRSAVADALARLQPSLAAPDVVAAAGLAAGERAGDGEIVVVSDGTVDRSTDALWPAGTRHQQVGSGDTNWSIHLGIDSRRDPAVAVVTVRNHGTQDGRQEVWLEVEGSVVARRTVELGGGEQAVASIEFDGGPRVTARLTSADQFGGDDVSHAVVGGAASIRVQVVGPPDPYLEAALQAMASTEVTWAPAASDAVAGADVTIFHQAAVPEDWEGPVLGFAVPSGIEGVGVGGRLVRPIPTLVDAADPWMRGLDLSGLEVGTAQALSVAGDPILLGAQDGPLLVRGSRRGVRFATFAFAPQESNVGELAAFPVLIDRAVTDLAGLDAATLTVGETPTVTSKVMAQGPSGRRIEIVAGDDRALLDERGFWTFESDGREWLAAVNVAASESTLAPRTLELAPPGPGSRATVAAAPSLRWVRWALIALSVVLVAELWLARPRRRSDRWLGVARVAPVAMVTLAIVWPPGARSHGLSVVVLVDRTGSMTPAGVTLAERFAAQTRATAGADVPVQVVGFGGGGTGMADIELGPSATLADALRYGGNLLGADGARRIVVASDGRVGTAGVAEELAALRRAGVVMESHPIIPAEQVDVAVQSVEVPAPLRDGGAVPVTVTLRSRTVDEARLSTSVDGVVVDERVVALAEGDSEVLVELAPVAGPVARLSVAVSASVDAERGNDVGFAALRVTDAASVLVVEGAPGVASWLGDALRGGGLGSDTVEARALPGLEDLMAYDAIVLVDVSARQLSPVQQAALVSVTRDGGRGLVVVGGQQSFALGEYATSQLEALLPVSSDLSNSSDGLGVAQVLAIDSSASMGACHCDELVFDEQGGLVSSDEESGLDKTELSKAAVAAAVASIGANDEIGVLAFDTDNRWIVPLGPAPDAATVTEEMEAVTPQGETDLLVPLQAAADALRSSRSALRHIVLLTDGFTYVEAFDTLEAQAAELADAGITVSVMTTGEAFAERLEPVARAGRGRYYAGLDLLEIPALMRSEALLAARDVAADGGQSTVEVLAGAPAVDGLAQAPALTGHLTLSARDGAQVQMLTDGVPLLASWRVGLGRVTAWTSDGGERWMAPWLGWEGFQPFWQAVVQGTFPVQGVEAATVQAVVDDDRLVVIAERPEGWAATASATATVQGPDGNTVAANLVPDGAGRLVGDVPAGPPGVYVVGAEIADGVGTSVLGGSAVVAYDRDLVIRPADAALVADWSVVTGGRGVVDAGQAVDRTGVRVGSSARSVPSWWVPAAIGLWLAVLVVERVRRA